MTPHPLQVAETAANAIAAGLAWALWFKLRKDERPEPKSEPSPALAKHQPSRSVHDRFVTPAPSHAAERAYHGPVAVALLLSAGVGAAVLHELLASLVPSARPIVDPSALLALRLDQARLLTWHLAVAVTVALAFRLRPFALAVALAWPVVLLLAALLPHTERAHLALYIAAAAVPVAIAAWCLARRNGNPWTISQRTAAIVCAGELGALLTYIRNPWKGAAWTPAQAGYLVAFGIVAAVQGGALWSGRQRRE